MLVNTHHLMGRILGEYYEREFSYGLNIKSFQKGIVKPDLEPELRKLEHRFEAVKDLLPLWEKEILSPEKDLADFSEGLGIICHFLSDFFCAYHHHDELFDRNILRHLFYEFIIHIRLKACLFLKKNFFILSGVRKEEDNWQNVLYKFRKKYSIKKRNTRTDLLFALNCSAEIGSRIIAKRAKELKKKLKEKVA